MSAFAVTNSHLIESPDSPILGVRFWTTQIETLTADEAEQLERHLNAAERARAERFHFERDRSNFIGVRGLLRELLGATLGADPSSLVLEYGPHGKPALAASNDNPLDIRFSISHSSGWAMFAISNGLEIGVDLESAARLRRSEPNLEQLAARILSPRELRAWGLITNLDERIRSFLRAWTRKEAYVKGTGLGLSEGLQPIEVGLDPIIPGTRITITSNTGDRTWILHDLLAPQGFVAAMAVETLKVERDPRARC